MSQAVTVKVERAKQRDVLESLGLDEEHAQALCLLPAIWVAWAGGSVSRARRAKIMEIGRRKGWLNDDSRSMVGGWLAQRPERDRFDAGLALLRELAVQARNLGERFRPDVSEDVLDACEQVASAGLLGTRRSIGAAQDQEIAAIAEGLGLDEGRTWRDAAKSARAREANVSAGPPGRPIIGILPEFNKDLLATMVRSYHQYPPLPRIEMLGRVVHIVAHPDHIRYINLERPRNFQRHGFAFDELREAAGRNMITVDGDDWRRLRQISQPALRKDRVAEFLDRIVSVTTEAIDTLSTFADTGEKVCVDQVTQDLSIRIFGVMCFGFDIDHDTSGIRESMLEAMVNFGNLASPIRLPHKIPTPQHIRFRRAKEDYFSHLHRLVKERRANPEAYSDLLTRLVGATHEVSGETLSDQEIVEEAAGMMIAGHESISSTLTWAVYELNRNPVVARKVREEVDRVLGGRTPTHEDIKQLEYTRAFIYEVLRLYSPVGVFLRVAVTEDEIGGFKVPANSILMLCPFITHRLPEFWPNPDGFDPERFTDPEVLKGAWRSGRFMPFGRGEHFCVGMALAELQSIIVIAMIAQRLELDVRPHTVAEPFLRLSIQPKDPIYAHVRARTAGSAGGAAGGAAGDATGDATGDAADPG